MAGLNLSDEGLAFLAKDMRLKNRTIMFEVIKPTDRNADAADAVISVKKVCPSPKRTFIILLVYLILTIGNQCGKLLILF